jgi:hypothetical protein
MSLQPIHARNCFTEFGASANCEAMTSRQFPQVLDSKQFFQLSDAPDAFTPTSRKLKQL